MKFLAGPGAASGAASGAAGFGTSITVPVGKLGAAEFGVSPDFG